MKQTDLQHLVKVSLRTNPSYTKKQTNKEQDDHDGVHEIKAFSTFFRKKYSQTIVLFKDNLEREIILFCQNDILLSY